MKRSRYVLGLGIIGFLIAGCASSRTSYQAIDSCEFRGGFVEEVCTLRPPDDPYSCDNYADACVGAGLSVEEWCKQEVVAWEAAESRNDASGAAVVYHPMPPSYCFSD